MAKVEGQLKAAKVAYKNAKAEGNHQEEARWANVIGDLLKNKGEYVQALKWLRIDYEISVKHLPEKHLLPTCQSIGEVYLRLNQFKDALIYQKKHLELAKNTNDLIEEQRANTQLGRTYHEIFLSSEDNHSSVRNAKKYFKSAMKLAHDLKTNPPAKESSFLKEYIDAFNNIGMLEIDLDNFQEAKRALTEGLKICDDEEINQNDAVRSRLNHNLGCVYMELRAWDRAREHIEKDIRICNRIGHCQGEAKGYINLGELHYRLQRYDEATICYQKASDLASSMEDEDALLQQTKQNIETVIEAKEVMHQLKKDEQNLKKLTRNMAVACGTAQERKLLLQQYTLLSSLVEKARMICAWILHKEFSKSRKKVAAELCDKEKQGDSLLDVGESYQKLRNFSKALKWFNRSWETYKAIENLEGQALAKINIGHVLDCSGDYMGALISFEEGYGIAVKANLPSTQLMALENMHYSHLIRFDNVEEARILQLEIEHLKQPEVMLVDLKKAKDYCSETDTDGENGLQVDGSARSFAKTVIGQAIDREESLCFPGHVIDDAPTDEVSSKCSSKGCNRPKAVGSKRVRVILSDDEDGSGEGLDCSNRSCYGLHMGTANGNKGTPEESAFSHKSASFEVTRAENVCGLSPHEEAFTSPCTATSSRCDVSAFQKLQDELYIFCNSLEDAKHGIFFRMHHGIIHFEASQLSAIACLSYDTLKVELACFYYLQLPTEKRSKGLLPIIHNMELHGRVLEPFECLELLNSRSSGRIVIDVSVAGWVQKRLMKLYSDFCKALSEEPNLKLLKSLYTSEVEDEVVASDCDLQDESVIPLLNALNAHKFFALVDLSHNLLGNQTMEKFVQLFTSSRNYSYFTFDFHCNRFGPTSLFQICECPVLYNRLEVLNVSGNRLTDACGSYISTLLEKCTALYSLSMENCAITSRTIMKISDAIKSSSPLTRLSIGNNSPISGSSLINLLSKLTTVKSFSDLNLNGIKLNKEVIISICQFARSLCLSHLVLGSTGFGTDGALQLLESLRVGCQDSLKLDLSHCGLRPIFCHQLNNTIPFNICKLNLGGNPIGKEVFQFSALHSPKIKKCKTCSHEDGGVIMHEWRIPAIPYSQGGDALSSLLRNPECPMRVLILHNCQLGLAGILQIVQSLAGNNFLEELNLASNCEEEKVGTLQSVSSANAAGGTGQHEFSAAKSEQDSSATGTSFSCQYIRDLSAAIGSAKRLQMLDLSNNSFTKEDAEALYTTWSSRLESGVAWRHAEDQLIHFSVAANKCCRKKPCCRND